MPPRANPKLKRGPHYAYREQHSHIRDLALESRNPLLNVHNNRRLRNNVTHVHLSSTFLTMIARDPARPVPLDHDPAGSLPGRRRNSWAGRAEIGRSERGLALIHEDRPRTREFFRRECRLGLAASYRWKHSQLAAHTWPSTRNYSRAVVTLYRESLRGLFVTHGDQLEYHFTYLLHCTGINQHIIPAG